MSDKTNIPKERTLKRDYFMVFIYILVALLVLAQFFVMFSIDIMDTLGL